VVDPWKAHMDAIVEKGLRIEGASGDRTVRNLHIVNAVAMAGEAQLFVTATKASAVAEVASTLVPVLSTDSIVLTIQNGLGSGERIAQHLPAEHVLLGVAEGFGASVKAAGHVQHTAMKMIRIGSMTLDDGIRTEAIAELWREAGFNAEAYSDIEQLIWEKFICNVAYSAPCAVFNKSVAALLQDPNARQISQSCAMEAWHVAVAKDINLTFSDPIDYITAFGERVGNAKPSLLLDLLAQRPSEIDAINGMVPTVAAEVGLTAPYNEVVSAIVHSREQAWQR